MGVINVLSAATPGLRDRLALLRQVLPLEVRFGSHLAATLSGFALLLLARSLWRRKRAAWSLTLLILLVSTVSHVLKGLDFEEALLSAGLALWLVRLRPAFSARSDRPSARRALWFLPAALGFTLAYGVLGLALLDHHFTVNFDLMQATRQVAVMLTEFTDPVAFAVTPFGRYFAWSIYIVATVTMGYALLAVVRPVLVRDPASDSERARATSIVEAHGRTSLAWFALASDKSYYFSPGGSVVAFVVRRRVCLALGDPIGPPDDLDAALSGFGDFCAERDWWPAFAAVEPETLAAYHSAGYNALCIGHEAIVPLAEFTLAGGRRKDLRGRVTRLKNLGYAARLHDPPLSDALLEELRAVSDEWLDTVGAVEQSFSVGAFEDDYLRSSPVMAVHDPQGAVCAFANLYPEFRRNEATVDLMRRRRRAENGLMEYLFVSLFEWARCAGYDTFNLGLSPLAGVGDEAGDPATERALRYIFENSKQFYNFQGLYGFKAKFHPVWSPRYLIYPHPSCLLPVVVALIQANAGDGFLWKMLGAQRKRLAEPPPPGPPPRTRNDPPEPPHSVGPSHARRINSRQQDHEVRLRGLKS